MRRLYTMAISATIGTSFNAYTGCVWATSKSEAEGKAMQLCKDYFPLEDGYGNHRVIAEQIPDQHVRLAYARLQEE